ncbi:MAG: peptidylprolyl isomerase [Anaerolineales bacterium]|nr:peptidylprolyl isomerase [Anaerolineales bacterium]
MRKKLSILLLLTSTVLLLLSACGSQQNLGTSESAVATEDTLAPPPETTSPPAVTCTVQSQQTPDLAEPKDHITGKLDDYAVTIIVYNDFSCEGCFSMAQTLATTLELFPDDVRLIFRYFPILGSTNDNGIIAAKAAEAAARQGKFWEMHDLLFSTQQEWRNLDPAALGEFIWNLVSNLGLDPEQMDEDMNAPGISELITQHYDQARRFNAAPPLVLVEGSAIPLYINTVEDFLIWLDTLMIPYGRHVKDNLFNQCPPMTINETDRYTATLHTNKGDIVLALYPDVAPVTVNNFIFLAESDYYDNTPFYAVIEGYVAQAGDPSGTGWGTPGFFYDLETSPALTFDRPYMLAMGSSGPGASNSQFFITFNPLSQLNGQHTIFGEVLDGVEVLQILTPRDPEKDPLAPMDDILLDITIEKYD